MTDNLPTVGKAPENPLWGSPQPGRSGPQGEAGKRGMGIASAELDFRLSRGPRIRCGSPAAIPAAE